MLIESEKLKQCGSVKLLQRTWKSNQVGPVKKAEALSRQAISFPSPSTI